MAISRNKKQTLVVELSELLENARGIAGASYTGLSVADLQELRKEARKANIIIKVSKNRLMKVALSKNSIYGKTNSNSLKGQLIYAFSNDDEIAPAQLLAKFAKKHPKLQLVAGFSNDGSSYNTAEIIAIADLPTKKQLQGQFVSVVAAPLTNTLRVLSGAQSGFARVLSERAKSL